MDESWRRRRPEIHPSDDFRDVFGGPPRSVLLRHFSPSTRHPDTGSRTLTSGDMNSHYSTVFCKPHEFVSTVNCGRNGFHHVTKRELEMANGTVASSTRYSDDRFRVMKRENDSSHETESGFNVSTTNYENTGSTRVMNREEDDDVFSEDHAFICNNAFRVLRREEEFYNDIFRSDNCGTINGGLMRRSRSRSFSKSESESIAFNCCESNGYGDEEGDRMLASFASKLRPITIPSKRYENSSPPSTISEGDSRNILRYAGPACPSSPSSHFRDHNFNSRNSNNNPNTVNKSRCSASSFCCFTPPDTLSVEPSFRLSFKKPPSPEEENSPPVVKVLLDISGCVTTEGEQSYVSEASVALEEAIAWAKERFAKEDDTIEGKNENFVGFKDWNANATEGKNFTDSKER